MKKRTVVIGASPNNDRFSNKAVRLLENYGHEVFPVGIRKGSINSTQIILEKKQFEEVDTVTMYVGPQRQSEFYDYIISLQPKRIIFNPGTENPEFYKLALENNIEVVEHCTLVMLNSGIY